MKSTTGARAAFDGTSHSMVPVSLPDDAPLNSPLRQEEFLSARYREIMIRLLEEQILSCGGVVPFIDEVFLPELIECSAAAIRKLLVLIRTEPKPKLAADRIAWVSGLSLMEGETVGTLSRAHGMSKQAFQQGAEQYRELFSIRSQTRRSPESRERMSKRTPRRVSV